jgi:hypothetical protein
MGSTVNPSRPFRGDQPEETTMNNNDASNPNDTGVSRRVTLTLAAGVAALGVALGMRSNAFAQGKGEGKLEGKGEGKAEGKEGRREGKAGRIRVDIDSDGATAVDVKCAEDEPMRACADLTKEIVDKIGAVPTK